MWRSARRRLRCARRGGDEQFVYVDRRRSAGRNRLDRGAQFRELDARVGDVLGEPRAGVIGGENLVELGERVVEKIGRRGLRAKTRHDHDGCGAIDGDIRLGGVAFRGVALGFVKRDDHIALPAGNNAGGGSRGGVAAGGALS